MVYAYLHPLAMLAFFQSTQLSLFERFLTQANSGIDSTGIWMAALFCGNCNNPAPWSITILEPCQ